MLASISLRLRRAAIAFAGAAILAVLVPLSAVADELTPALVDSLNLSFEKADPPDRWSAGVTGHGPLNTTNGYEITADAQVAHDGARSLRLSGSGKSAAASTVLPLAAVRGKWVRLSGWIRTRDVTGFGGLWMRVDGTPRTGTLAFDNMHERGPKGTTEWAHYEVEPMLVTVDARGIVIGAILNGGGMMWADGLSVAVSDTDPRPVVDVHGVVRDAAGKPVAGAWVAAIHGSEPRPAKVVRTGSDGAFAAQLTADPWAFTATSDAGIATYQAAGPIATGTAVELVLGAKGFTITGRLVTDVALPPDMAVYATRLSKDEGDIFVTYPDARGRYRLRLPVALGYTLEALGSGVSSPRMPLAKIADQVLDIEVAVPGPPPEDVVRWVARTAIPLTTVEAGHGFDDMRPLDKLVGGARIVALGEATHGTREFFQMKHRMLEYLVEKKGFRIFAIEANLPEARRVNEYVLHGTGSATAALSGMYFWTWDTEEVLALIEWMRAYNMDPAHDAPVQFMGFDMQIARVALTNVRTFFAEYDSAFIDTLPARLTPFAFDGAEGWKNLDPAKRSKLRTTAGAIVARLDTERTRYSKMAGAAAWRAAREDARVIAQAAAKWDAQNDQGFTSGFNIRDAAMAENVAWMLEQAGPKSKIVLWAHNSHIAFEMPEFINMGSQLQAKYHTDYLTMGFVFAAGSFQANGGDASPALQVFDLGPAPVTDVSAAFTRAGEALCIVDLRHVPPGPVARWFEAAHPMRELGAGFAGEEFATHDQSLARRFSAVIFVAQTTAARANPSGRRDH